MRVRNYRTIRALRGLSACIVVIFHAAGLWSENVSRHPRFWQNGAAGVDLFFVISGFVLALTHDRSPWAFIKRRVIRVVPLYWLMTTVMLVKAATVYIHPDLAHGAGHADLAMPYIAASYLFIPYRNSIGQTVPLLPVGWTLSFEMLFYAFFAIAIALRVNAIRLLAPIFAVFALVGMFVTSSAVMTLASPILLEFIAGLWLGNFAKSGRRINKNAAIASGIIGLVVILAIPMPSPNLRPFTWGLSAFLIVFSAIGLEQESRLPEWTQKLGDASYSLYLSHVPIFSVCYQILNRGAFTSPYSESITVTTCLLLSLTGAAFVHRLIEIPITVAVKGWITPEVRLQLVTSSR